MRVVLLMDDGGVRRKQRSDEAAVQTGRSEGASAGTTVQSQAATQPLHSEPWRGAAQLST